MTITELGAPGSVTAPTGLAFERPVERSLVHRRSVTEVFVTDAAQISENTFAVAAQLPRAHRYFTDHLVRPALVDPLLILECCRQAATTVAHAYLGVAADSAFLVTRWGTRLDRPDALVAGDEEPDELALQVGARDVKVRNGRVMAASLDMELFLRGSWIGSSTVSAGYLQAGRYADYRALRRSTPPPLSAALPRERPADLAPSGSVGRHLAENVVLADASAGPGGAQARLDAAAHNLSLYDHPLDHVPAMALLEAARQAAVFAAGQGDVADGWYATGLEAEFGRFVELDATTRVTARPSSTSGTVSGPSFTVEFRQHDDTVCTAEVVLASLPREGGRR
ncbi:ScbA/BarX family gamma-butyrolactone biosynthesis protein [Streptomyces morookaense]|uniref:ScbA/BarX family gamma-butyrolactone biosynthesis protein n=1 Tax=Streptomyces morookaense TaxID=1970 RepID=UPI0033F898F9